MKFKKCKFEDVPKHLRKGVRQEPKPFTKAVHVGRAICDKTLGQSNSKLLVHGIYDEDGTEDFGEEPKRKETAKKTEETE